MEMCGWAENIAIVDLDPEKIRCVQHSSDIARDSHLAWHNRLCHRYTGYGIEDVCRDNQRGIFERTGDTRS